MRTADVHPIDATTMLEVSLQAQQWNSVLALLAEGPYRVAAPIIQAIAQQTQAIASGLGARGNGQSLAEGANDPS